MFMYMGSVEVTNDVKSVIHEGLIYEIVKNKMWKIWKWQMNEKEIEKIAGLFNDIYSYLNILDEGSEKYQYALRLAKEIYDKGLTPNDYTKEIIFSFIIPNTSYFFSFK